MYNDRISQAQRPDVKKMSKLILTGSSMQPGERAYEFVVVLASPVSKSVMSTKCMMLI